MTDYTDFNGTFTPHYEFAKPSGEDKVSIDVLNDNMDKLDSILYDIYSRLGTTPQPVIDLPVEFSVSEMVQNPLDSVTISYVNNAQKLNLSTEKSYICTIVGKDGTNYIYNNPLVPEEISEEGFTYLSLGGFLSGNFTPSLVSPITALDSIVMYNGISFDAEGNPVIDGFMIDVSAGDSQGNPHTDAIRESVDKIIISEYTE